MDKRVVGFTGSASVELIVDFGDDAVVAGEEECAGRVLRDFFLLRAMLKLEAVLHVPCPADE